ncbi:FAD-dependent monooxygenase [Streptomyces pactum]|uniref:FAD-dependent monooxygenase n=1 Tax=Streptomyces pactum TaxID=68249 RepID=A0ABS0NSF2_9ACTN|nr:FAD-dependent monooxygenase [Streptomyces pactum]MBH5338142.1 FAD-dependent monooxygenase [Streptomyces pactum]
MPAADAEVAVLIVGGGPVGLTARALLERWGVPALLVEKHDGLSPFPRARLVNVRSMEIYRGLGLADRIFAGAFPPEYGRVRFRDTLLDQDFATAAMVGVNAPIPESPTIGVVTSQDRLEPILLAAARAPVRFGAELVELTEEDEGVTAVVLDRRRGGRTRVRARYVIAADGANSTVRRLLGIGTTGPGAMGRFTSIVFDADLDPWCAGRPAGVYFTAHGIFTPLYPEGGWARSLPTPEDPAHADWSALVSRALGSRAEVEVEVVRVQHWVMSAFVAECLRHGRTLLTGDAAHAVPVIGGLGMNAGIADVHNLCWKLAGVLQGWAGPGLVETYEPERHPVALRTLRQAVANTRLMLDVQERYEARRRSGEPEPTDMELPWSERYFAQLGLLLGVCYRSGAVLTGDGAAPEPPDPGTDYVPTTEPGHRMPHLWLGPGRSTLDAFGEWFTLLTPEPAREPPPDPGRPGPGSARPEQPAVPPWPLRTEPLPGRSTGPYDPGPRETLLVRPDGHVAARWHDGVPHVSAVRDALAALTAHPPEPSR